MPLLVPKVNGTDDLLLQGEGVLLERGYLRPGQEVVVLVGSSPLPGATNMMKIYSVGSQ